MIIQIDSREKKNDDILNYFDSVGQQFFVSKLYTADYVDSESNKVLIDRKANLLELCNNLCSSNGHDRVKAEIKRAKEIGCERFIFLIADEFIGSVDEVHNWLMPLARCYITGEWKPRTKVKPETLQKIMITMFERYDVEFIFEKPENMGRKIIELIGGSK